MKIYKIILSAVAFLGLQLSCAHAQKLLPPAIDKFTGDTTISTTTDRIFAEASPVAAAITVTTSRLKQTCVLTLHIIMVNGSGYFRVDNGQNINLKFSDNTIIKLPATKDFSTDDKLIGTNHRAEITCVYNIPPEDYSKFSNGVTAVRVETSKGNLDYDISSKFTNVIPTQFALIYGK